MLRLPLSRSPTLPPSPTESRGSNSGQPPLVAAAGDGDASFPRVKFWGSVTGERVQRLFDRQRVSGHLVFGCARPNEASCG